MRLKGRRQSGKVIDTSSNSRLLKTYEQSVASKRSADRAAENDFKDSTKADRIPKRMVGFDSRDMEKSAGLKRAVRKLKSLPMKKR